MAKEGQAIALDANNHAKMLAYLRQTRYARRDVLIYLLTVKAGMRIGSVAGLMIEDICNADGSIKEVVILRKSITKGAKTITAYLSHPELKAALVEYLRERGEKRVGNLIVSQKGSAFSPNSLSQLMLKHYKNAGIEGASSHSGRRTAITNWLKNGGDIVAVSKLAGHSSILTTQRYVYHNQEELMSLVSQ